jgi:hypothetical protein
MGKNIGTNVSSDICHVLPLKTKKTRTCFKRNKCDIFYIDLHDYIYDICNINETVGLFMSIYGINCATKYINRDVINMVNISMNILFYFANKFWFREMNMSVILVANVYITWCLCVMLNYGTAIETKMSIWFHAIRPIYISLAIV